LYEEEILLTFLSLALWLRYGSATVNAFIKADTSSSIGTIVSVPLVLIQSPGSEWSIPLRSVKQTSSEFGQDC
jgi:hypothetical protein